MPSRPSLPVAKITALALALGAAQPALPAQSALQRQHEAGLAAAGQTLARADAGDDTRAGALENKALALKNLGRHAEALEAIRQAGALAPGDLGVQMHTAVILDAAGDHQAARDTYDKIFDTLQAWHAGRAAILRKGGKPGALPQEAGRPAPGSALSRNSALNHVFLGNYARAGAQFTRDYEEGARDARADGSGDYDACWLLWLAAKSRAADGLRADVAVRQLADTLPVASPCHKELVRLWRGKGHWQKILGAIDRMEISGAEKEARLTEASFFAAGYYAYVKNDTRAALELLDAEDARPFNGCVERLFIRKEIAALRK